MDKFLELIGKTLQPYKNLLFRFDISMGKKDLTVTLHHRIYNEEMQECIALLESRLMEQNGGQLNRTLYRGPKIIVSLVLKSEEV